MAKRAAVFGRDNVCCLGTKLGKFTKTKKFRLNITALDIISKYALYKLYIKQNGEMSFLYGNHVVKAHLHNVSEDVPEHQGIIIYSSANNVPIGFGVTAKSSLQMKGSLVDPTAIIVYHQADVGEYLREEEKMK